MKKENKKKKKKIVIISSVIAVVLIICIGVGLYFVFNNDTPEFDEPIVNMEEIIAQTTDEPSESESAETENNNNDKKNTEYEEKDYNYYYSKNHDFVGWIKIDGTKISYPVVQTYDNEYYLTHNFYKKKEKRGTIFMAYDCDAELGSTNTVIHGHNWIDNSVFSQLVKYSDVKYYKNHPVIEYNTRNEMHKWKIVSIFITTATASEDNGYVFNYVYPNMGGANFDAYSSELKKRSLFDTGVDYNENDKFLTLSTCTREADKGKKRADCRIVIVARMVRPNESESVDTSKCKVNENPKYPQIWYDNKGKTNPYINDEKWYPIEIN